MALLFFRHQHQPCGWLPAIAQLAGHGSGAGPCVLSFVRTADKPQKALANALPTPRQTAEEVIMGVLVLRGQAGPQGPWQGQAYLQASKSLAGFSLISAAGLRTTCSGCHCNQ